MSKHTQKQEEYITLKGSTVTDMVSYARKHAKTKKQKLAAYDQIISAEVGNPTGAPMKVSPGDGNKTDPACVQAIKDPNDKETLRFLIMICPVIVSIFTTIEHAVSPKGNTMGPAKWFGMRRKGDKKHIKDVLALDDKFHLVYGPCQSGKTTFIQNTGLAHTLFTKCSVVTILRNSIGDSKQLRDRCDEFVEQHRAHMKSKGMVFSTKKSINYVYVGNTSRANLQKLRDALSGKTPSIIIAIANKYQMNRLQRMIDEIENPRYVLTIDEADQVVYGEDSAAFRRVLNTTLLPNAGRVYAVTATTFDAIFTEERIETANIIIMEPREGVYKGLEQIERRALENNVTPATNKKRWFSNDSYLIPLMTSFNTRNVYGGDIETDVVHNEHHPIIMLIKNTHLNKMQVALMKEIAKNPNLKNWCSVVYNGKGVYVHSPYTRFKPKMGRRQGEPVSGVKNALFFKGKEINEGLQYLYDINQKYPNSITHIAVIAGDKADRGISFVSTNYKWHVSTMYYVPSGATKNNTGASVSNIIQAAGRLNGNFNDAIPLKLYAPKATLDDLVKGIRIQNEMLARAKDGDHTKLLHFLYTMKLNKDKIPTKRLGRAKCVVQKVSGSDGGWSRKSYRKVLAKVKPLYDETDERKEPELSVDGILVLLEVNITSTVARRIYDSVKNALFNMGTGKWYTRANVIREVLASAEVEDGFTRPRLEAQLKDFGRKQRFHQGGNESTTGFLLRKSESDGQWMFRLNV